MKVATDWKDYIVKATANGEKLEVIGGYTFLRPDPQVIWKNDINLSTKVAFSLKILRFCSIFHTFQQKTDILHTGVLYFIAI